MKETLPNTRAQANLHTTVLSDKENCLLNKTATEMLGSIDRLMSIVHYHFMHFRELITITRLLLQLLLTNAEGVTKESVNKITTKDKQAMSTDHVKLPLPESPEGKPTDGQTDCLLV